MKTLLFLLFFAGQACIAQQSGSLDLNLRRELFGNHVEPGSIAASYEQNLESAGSRKNVGLAVLYSLLVPGMGELYAGNYESGKYFTVAEGALWLGFGGMNWYASSQQNDARSFAAQHAGISTEGKSDQYFIDVGDFQNTYAYNDQVLRSRDPEKLYDPASSDYWNWDEEGNRSVYRDRRVSADQVFNSTRFVVAAIAVNHVVSAINAARAVISHNRNLSTTDSFSIHADVLGGITHPDGIVVSFRKSF